MNTNSVFYFFLLLCHLHQKQTYHSLLFRRKIRTKSKTENCKQWLAATKWSRVTMASQASFKTKVQLIFKQKQINVIIISKWRSDFLYSVTAHYSFQVGNHLIWLDHNHLITIFLLFFICFIEKRKEKKTKL